MEKTDVAILCVSLFVVLLSFHNTTQFYFEKTFEYHFDTALYSNGRFPSDKEKLPRPLITDLDGNGIQEIVLVTPDYKIQVLDASKGTPIVLSEASLLPPVRIRTGRWPVALQSGYLTPGKPNLIREQTITVLLSNGAIMAFSSSLKLLWETSIVEMMPRNAFFREASLSVIPAPLIKGDQGAVVAAIRLGIDFDPQHEHEEHEEPEPHQRWKDQPDLQEPPLVDDEDHVRFYGIDGRTGAIRWRHEDNEKTSNIHDHQTWDDSVDPAHGLALHHLPSTHLGQQDWQVFKHHVIRQFPHRWRERSDTELKIDHFTRRRVEGGRIEATLTAEDFGFPTNFFGKIPHKEEDHVMKPNVVVFKGTSVVEVIHLFTGRTLCAVPLSPGASADLNGDGILDFLDILKESEGQCHVVAVSGIPAEEILFNGTICESLQGWSLFRPSTPLQPVEATLPLLIPSERSAPDLKQRGLSEWDSYFLVSTGRLTSYNPEGRLRWQRDTAAAWDVTRSPPLVPSLSHFQMDEQSEGFVVAVGESIEVLSLSGDQMTWAELNFLPLEPPIFGDFSNDGINEMIIVTAEGLVGFTLQYQQGYGLFQVVALVVVVGVVIVTFRQSQLPQPKQKRAE